MPARQAPLKGGAWVLAWFAPRLTRQACLQAICNALHAECMDRDCGHAGPLQPLGSPLLPQQAAAVGPNSPGRALQPAREPGAHLARSIVRLDWVWRRVSGRCDLGSGAWRLCLAKGRSRRQSPSVAPVMPALPLRCRADRGPTGHGC